MAPNAGRDWVPAGATWQNANVYGRSSPPAPGPLNSPADSVAFFQSLYQGFVTDPKDLPGLHDALIALANAPGAALFHCSGGKDRTGWVAVLLQTIAGVSPATIQQDYLATNLYTASQIDSMLTVITSMYGPQEAAILQPQLGVQSSFLQAALDAVATKYGSLQAYLTDGLGLSQADIYVLRAKMVAYPSLPGQSSLAGNAAAGAALLNALQNSPLSGHYTAYNSYLQSAIDAGTLGGVETQAGGQLHADAAAYLLRQSGRIGAAIAPYTDGRDLTAGQFRVWIAGLGGYLHDTGSAGVADSSERSAGPVAGATYRVSRQASASVALGYDWGSVESAGAHADVDTLFANLGGRYALTSLEAGPFAAMNLTVGGVDYHSRRPMGGGLGNARGSTNGAVYGGEAALGDTMRLGTAAITLQGGVQVTHATLDSFQESGSELALSINRTSATMTSLVVGLDVSLDPLQRGDWRITPTFSLGYTRALGNPQATASGQLYGFTVTQISAFNSRNLLTPGLGVSVQRRALTIEAQAAALLGDGAKSAGINGQLSIAYKF